MAASHGRVPAPAIGAPVRRYRADSSRLDAPIDGIFYRASTTWDDKLAELLPWEETGLLTCPLIRGRNRSRSRSLAVAWPSRLGHPLRTWVSVGAMKISGHKDPTVTSTDKPAERRPQTLQTLLQITIADAPRA